MLFSSKSFAVKDCGTFTRGIFESFNPEIKLGGKYYPNKSLPWLIKHTGHNPNKLTSMDIISHNKFTLAVPLNLLGETTSTFDDYFLRLQYRYGNVPSPEGVVNSNNIAFLESIEIVDYFGNYAMKNHRDELNDVFEKIKAMARTQVRKKSPITINMKITDAIEVPIIPYFRQSTVDDYISFMDYFFFTSQFDLLRGFKNKFRSFQNKTIRRIKRQEPLNKFTRADQSTLTQIETYRQYENRLRQLKLEKFTGIFLDRGVYTTIGAIIAVGAGIFIKFDSNKIKLTLPDISVEKLSEQEKQEQIEDALKKVDINKLFKKMLKEDPEFLKSVEEAQISHDTVFEIEVEVDSADSSSNNNIIKVEFEGKGQAGDTIRFEEAAEIIP